MKKIFLSVSSLMFLLTQASFAQVGYVDYSVIYKKLPVSQQYQKRIDIKAGQVRAYNLETQKQLNVQKTSEAKERIKTSRKDALIKLEREYIDLRYKQESVVKEKVKAASDIVVAKKKLDAIIDKKSVISGGVDCTEEVLKAIK